MYNNPILELKFSLKGFNKICKRLLKALQLLCKSLLCTLLLGGPAGQYITAFYGGPFIVV